MVPVVFDFNDFRTPAGAPAEETCPVEVVLIAKLWVSGDVNTAVIDPSQ